MSAISSVSSGAQTSLLQQLQQPGASGSFSRADFQKQRQADFAQALQSAGVDPSKVDDIQQQIDTAVQNVRQNGSASGTSQRDAVKDAVNNVLQQNGVDVTKFQQALKSQHAGHAHGHHKAAGSDGDGDSDSNAAPSIEGSSTSQTGTLSAKIADLLKSLASGTTQQSDLSGLPAGSLLDVAA